MDQQAQVKSYVALQHLDRLALRRLDAVVVVARHMLALRALQGVAASRRHVIENGIPSLTARLDDLAARAAAPLPAALVSSRRAGRP